MADDLLTIKEAAYAAGVTRRTIERWLRAGRIEARRAYPASRRRMVAAIDVTATKRDTGAHAWRRRE